MRTWQFVSLLGFLVIVLGTILWLVPGTNYLVRGFLGGLLGVLLWLWMVLKGIICLALVLAFSGLLAFLVKAFFIAWLDGLAEPGKEMIKGMHWGVSIVLGIIAALLHASAMLPLMTWETWLRSAAIAIGWSGGYETLPMGWAIWGMISFLLVYHIMPYLTEPTQKRDQDND